MKNHYDILGVSPTATKEEIKRAYRKLSVKFHPDKNDGEPFFAEMFKQVNEAHEVLLDDFTRQKYDSALKQYVNRQDRSQLIDELHSMNENLKREREAYVSRLRSQEERSKVNPSPTPRPVSTVKKRNYSYLWRKVRRWRSISRIALCINVLLVAYFFLFPTDKHNTLKAVILGANGRIIAQSGVNVREEPAKGSRVITAIPLGKQIKIIEKDGLLETLDGQQGRWYKIHYTKSGMYRLNLEVMEGWIWGATVEDL